MAEKEFNEQTKDGKVYRTFFDENGHEMREYRDTGVVRNMTTNRIVGGYITRDNASELQVMGTEAKRMKPIEAARRGLLRGVSATELVEDYEMAWEHVVAAQAQLAMTPDMGNASTRAAEFLMRVADLDPYRSAGSLELSDGHNTLKLDHLSAEKLDYILERLNNV